MPTGNFATAREKNEIVKWKNFVSPADDETPFAFSVTPSMADGVLFVLVEPAENTFGVSSGSSVTPFVLSKPPFKADGVPSVLSEVFEKIFVGLFTVEKTPFFSSEPSSAAENPASNPYFIRTLAENETVGITQGQKNRS